MRVTSWLSGSPPLDGWNGASPRGVSISSPETRRAVSEFLLRKEKPIQDCIGLYCPVCEISGSRADLGD
jgi:hypothetical protein